MDAFTEALGLPTAWLEISAFVVLAVYLFLGRRARSSSLQPTSKSSVPSPSKPKPFVFSADAVELTLKDDGTASCSFRVALPRFAELTKLKKLHLDLSTADVDVVALVELPQLQHLSISGPVLRCETLAAFENLAQLCTLDLSACRAVVEDDNSIKGFARAADVYEMQARRQFQTLLLPSHAGLEIGTVVKVFSKAQVIVISLSRPLRLGDRLQLCHVARKFTGAEGSHRELTPMITVDSIRTDDHTQLEIAVPDPQRPASDVDNQVAIKFSSAAARGDRVEWCGHASMRLLSFARTKTE